MLLIRDRAGYGGAGKCRFAQLVWDLIVAVVAHGFKQAKKLTSGPGRFLRLATATRDLTAQFGDPADSVGSAERCSLTQPTGSGATQ